MTIILLSSFIWFACTKDSFEQKFESCIETPTYNTNMQAIVDTYCAYAECHNGSAGVPGDYRTYEGMRIHFGASILERVVTIREDAVLGMPPARANGPTDLSEEDFKLFNCWINEEFPEN